MIRLIQRRLIVPRGDTGTFSIPMLAGKDNGDMSIFTIFNPLTHRKVFEKVMNLSDGVLTMDLTHGDTVNLPVGQYVWDIKFYDNPVIVDDKLVSGEEVDSYYAAFQLPVCEIRETGDNLLMDDNAPTAKLAPDQINYIDAAIVEIHTSMDAAVESAADAATSATNAETSASAAAASAQAALDNQVAALASQQSAQAAASDAANSANTATVKAGEASTSATNAAQSASDSAANKLAAQAAQSAAEAARDNASASASAASTSEQNAGTSEANAANSATAAANSAAAALASQTAANTSETNAAASATAAANSATAAAASAAQAQQTAQGIHEEIPTKISDLEDDSGHYIKPDYGIPATDLANGIQIALQKAITAYQKPSNGIPATDLEETYLTQHQDISGKANIADLATVATSGSYDDLSDKPTIPDIQINGNSIVDNGIANIPLATNGAVGLVKGNNTYGTAITAAGDVMIYRADDSAIKNGNGEYKPIVPYTEHQAVFYGLAKAAGDTTQRESQNNVGIYTSSAKSAIQAMLDVPSTNSVASSIASAVGNVHSFDVEVVQSLPTQNIKEHTIYFVPKTGETNDVYDEYIYVNNAWEMVGNTQIDLSDYATKSEIPEVPVQDVQINGSSIISSGVANIPVAGSKLGLVRINPALGVTIAADSNPSAIRNCIGIVAATDEEVKTGTINVKPITPASAYEATFYGLAKAAGDTTQKVSTNAVGTYTAAAKEAIQQMLDVPSTSDIPSVPVQDVQVNGMSVVSNGVANVPIASTDAPGAIRLRTQAFSITSSTGLLDIRYATSNDAKGGANVWRPITTSIQHESAFYGLAKAAGDSTQSVSTNAVGTYTSEAKAAIQTMLDVPSNTDLTLKANKTDTVLETTLSRGRKDNTTVGGASLAFGVDTEASGYYSIALGLNTTASSQGAFAEGKNTVAHYIAHAEGENSQALSSWSHAQNVNTIANGGASSASGRSTIANGADSFVFGRYNAADSYDNWPTWVANTSYEVGDRVKRNLMVQNQPTDVGYHCTVANSDATFDNAHWELDGYHMNYVEIVGNGKEYEDPETHQTVRAGSNAYALEWNGTARYMGDVYVGANADSTGGTRLATVTEVAAKLDAAEAGLKVVRLI